MCRCLVKFIIFTVNIIFLLIGLLIIGGGVFVIYQLNKLTQITDQLPYSINLDFVPYVIIGLGAVVFLIAFAGCCGSITETKCLLVTYAVCMALLAAAKIVITILLFVKLPDLRNTVEGTVDDMFFSDDSTKNVTFHLIEAQLKCCGTFGPDAYVNDFNLTSPTCCPLNSTTTLPIDNLPIDNLPINLTTKNLHRENLPIDISNLPPGSLPGNIDLGNIDLGNIDLGNIDLGDIDLGDLDLSNLTMCRREDAYETGCTTLIGDAFQSYGISFGTVLIVVIGFELFAMSFTIYLIKSMKPKKGKVVDHRPRYYY